MTQKLEQLIWGLEMPTKSLPHYVAVESIHIAQLYAHHGIDQCMTQEEYIAEVYHPHLQKQFHTWYTRKYGGSPEQHLTLRVER